MKSFLRTFLIAGILGGVWFGVYVALTKDFSPIWSGIMAGLILGLATAILTRFRQNRATASEPVLTEEKILREGRATHEDMSGRLYLTDRRILFEGYPTDETAPEVTRLFEAYDSETPGHAIEIPVIRIADAVGSRPLGMDSRLDITLTDGTKKYFGTEDLNDWLDDISTARQMYLDEPRSEDKKLFP